ncbi:MAG: methyltransferase [Nanoarchaeota archaeon]
MCIDADRDRRIVFRKSFRDCSVFTAGRSLTSIIEACDFEHMEKRPLSVLDAFAGDGAVADGIARWLCELKIDYSIAVAEINPVHLKNASDEYVKFCRDIRTDKIDGEYDIISVRYGLHDLAYDDKIKAIQNLSGSLAMRGRIVISDIMPDKKSRPWLEMHHQRKEVLTNGPNREVCLSDAGDYLKILNEAGVSAEVKDSFYQEVFLREWVETYGASEETIAELDRLALEAPRWIQERLMIFYHPKRGARIYFPVVTIAGIKNG